MLHKQKHLELPVFGYADNSTLPVFLEETSCLKTKKFVQIFFCYYGAKVSNIYFFAKI